MHELDLEWLEGEIAPLYSDKGRPGVASPFPIGLLLLKQIFGLHEEVCDRWVYGPYFQHFTGVFPARLSARALGVTGGAFPRKVGGENRTVTAGRRPWWPRMAGLQPLSTRAFGPRLRRLTALTALATRPLIATKRSTVRCGQSVCKCHAEKFRSAIFARILTAVHTRLHRLGAKPGRLNTAHQTT